MTKKKTEFQVTIGYKAIVTVSVKANSEEEAKKLALEEFEGYRHFGNRIDIQYDSFAAHGVLNMDETWNKF